MPDDTLQKARQAVIDAAKAMFAPFPSHGQMFTIEHDADMRKVLHGAVRELEHVEGTRNANS